MSKKLKKIVCIGGGTGVSMILSGLFDYPLDLKAIVTMFDDGGSSGEIRRMFNVLPPGDIRQCLIAASRNKEYAQTFTYRFQRSLSFLGKKLGKGHSSGNIEIVRAFIESDRNLNKAIDNLSKELNTNAKIIPVTLESSNLKAELNNGKKIDGEEEIINCRDVSKKGIKKLFLLPKVKANPRAILAIKEADLIVIGPGKLYTSVIPNFLVEGISESIRKSRAKKVFICNLMTQEGNTDNFKVEDFLKNIERFLGKGSIDYVIFNTGKLSSVLVKEVKKVFPKIDFVGYEKDLIKKKNFIGADLLDKSIRKLNPADILVKGANQRTIVFHDSKELAKHLLKLV